MLQIIVNILYLLFGKNTYKALRSYPDLEQKMSDVLKTLKVLYNAESDDTIITGISTFNMYKFWKCHFYDILVTKYAVLNDNFIKMAITSSNARIAKNNFHEDVVNATIKPLFKLESIGVNCKPCAEKGDIMTANEWNLFWSDLLELAQVDKAMENLSLRCLTLNQLPGCVKFDGTPVLDDAGKEVKDEDGNIKCRKVAVITDYRNENEYPMEFVLITAFFGPCMDTLSAVEHRYEITELKDTYDVHSYLFSDIQ